MQLSRALTVGDIPHPEGQEVLEIIESFLVRRAICGHEPTGLHAVFKRLWVDCGGTPTPDNVISEIKKHRTVVWPDDKAVREAMLTRKMYGAGITKYILLQYDLHLGGDQPSDSPWIEHVLPENPSKGWFLDFTKREHAMMKDRIANLIPLSEKMNTSLSNKPYDAKRATYLEDAMYKSARKLAQANKTWAPETIEKRGRKIARWAVKRWPF